jgi:hypothetical protein
MLKALLFIAGLAFAGAAAAQHKWVDSNGKVQYGDTPPPGVRSTPVRPPPPASSGPPAPGKKGPLGVAERDAEFRKRRNAAEQDHEKQAKARQEADDKRENCARAQENVRMLENGRVARTDAKGERYYLDDAQIQQETARARQTLREWCS